MTVLRAGAGISFAPRHTEIIGMTAAWRLLRAAALQFRNEIISGVGGSQIILEDPFGNPIELFQPA
jgi:hypothetical protein